MEVNKSLALAAEKLKTKVKNPHLEAEILLSHILKKPREFLFAYPEKKLTKTQISNIQYLISKRLKGIPVAYLIGYKYFYGLKFKVNKNVLIPRPETELMVDEALHISRNAYRVTHNAKHVIIVDAGTGSGCVIIAIIKKLQELSSEASGLSFLNIQYLGTDISRPALQIARQNAKLHKVNNKIKFLHGNLLEPIIKYIKELKIVNCKLIICANLPYLTPAQIKKSPSIKHEPKLALDAGKDGLKYYRQLFKQLKKFYYLQPTTCNLICEIDPSQAQKIKKIAKKEFLKSKIQIKKDLNGLDRLAIIKFSKK